MVSREAHQPRAPSPLFLLHQPWPVWATVMPGGGGAPRPGSSLPSQLEGAVWRAGAREARLPKPRVNSSQPRARLGARAWEVHWGFPERPRADAWTERPTGILQASQPRRVGHLPRDAHCWRMPGLRPPVPGCRSAGSSGPRLHARDCPLDSGAYTNQLQGSDTRGPPGSAPHEHAYPAGWARSCTAWLLLTTSSAATTYHS